MDFPSGVCHSARSFAHTCRDQPIRHREILSPAVRVSGMRRGANRGREPSREFAQVIEPIVPRDSLHDSDGGDVADANTSILSEHKAWIPHRAATGIVKLSQALTELFGHHEGGLYDRRRWQCVEREPLRAGVARQSLTEGEEPRGRDAVSFQVKEDSPKCSPGRTP